MNVKRVFLFVLDSFGIGSMPDAKDYGDEGANTLKSVCKSSLLSVPCMESLGLFSIDGTDKKATVPIGVYGRMAEASLGKDTIIGHWEICGIRSEKDLPHYPDGFPDEIIKEFERITGRAVLCNKPYSGTKVIGDFGEEHLRTGNIIVYTSADSVFQVAAHTDVVPLEKLYEYCEKAREMLRDEHGVGRVIARPFTGEFPFKRTSDRHDYPLKPPAKTLLDNLKEKDFDVIAVGKINDIFCSQGVTEYTKTTDNDDGMRVTDEYAKKDFRGLCFINLVDFDMLYGHRRDCDGYAAALTRFDKWLTEFINKMRDDDMVIITGDHGCDPRYKGTDHTREYTPLLMYKKGIRPRNLGTRKSFADIGATVAEIFGVAKTPYGTSFISSITE